MEFLSLSRLFGENTQKSRSNLYILYNGFGIIASESPKLFCFFMQKDKKVTFAHKSKKEETACRFPLFSKNLLFDQQKVQQHQHAQSDAVVAEGLEVVFLYKGH